MFLQPWFTARESRPGGSGIGPNRRWRAGWLDWNEVQSACKCSTQTVLHRLSAC